MMPEGLEYVSNWIDVDLKTCWQLMRPEDESLFEPVALFVGNMA